MARKKKIIEPILINGETSLMIAVRKGDLKLVKDVIDKGVDNVDFKNKNGHTALDISTIKGYKEISKFLSTK